jgi:hypothetical protein
LNDCDIQWLHILGYWTDFNLLNLILIMSTIDLSNSNSNSTKSMFWSFEKRHDRKYCQFLIQIDSRVLASNKETIGSTHDFVASKQAHSLFREEWSVLEWKSFLMNIFMIHQCLIEIILSAFAEVVCEWYWINTCDFHEWSFESGSKLSRIQRWRFRRSGMIELVNPELWIVNLESVGFMNEWWIDQYKSLSLVLVPMNRESISKSRFFLVLWIPTGDSLRWFSSWFCPWFFAISDRLDVDIDSPTKLWASCQWVYRPKSGWQWAIAKLKKFSICLDPRLNGWKFHWWFSEFTSKMLKDWSKQFLWSIFWNNIVIRQLQNRNLLIPNKFDRCSSVSTEISSGR